MNVKLVRLHGTGTTGTAWRSDYHPHEENVLVVPCAAPQATRAAVQRRLADAKLCERRGAGARRFVEET